MKREKIENYVLRYKWTIIGGLVGGGISHFYVLTNILQNHDNVAVQPSGYGTGVESGRWVLSLLGDLVGKLGGNYNLSWFNGMLAILILTSACCVITELFQLSNCHGFLFATVFLAYPTVSSTFFFMFTSVYYAVAVWMSIVSVYLTKRYKFGFIAGSILTACSLGIYQAYFPMAATLFVVLLIIQVLNQNACSCDISKRVMRYLLTLAMGLLIYFIGVKASKNLYGVVLNTYAGTEQIANFKLADIPDMLAKCYSGYYLLFSKNYYTINYNSMLKLCFFVAQLGSIALVVLAWREKQMKLVNIIISAILIFLVFPIAINGTEIICYNSSRIYVLMIYATVFIFLLPMVLWDNTSALRGSSKEGYSSRADFQIRTLHRVLLLFISLAFLSYAYMANIKYTAMYYMNQQTTNYYNELVTRIKSADGYSMDCKLAFIGDTIEDTSFKNKWAEIGDAVGAYTYLINTYSRNEYIKNYLGYTFESASREEMEKLLSNRNVTQMPCYPESGSIRVVDHVVVVKFSK